MRKLKNLFVLFLFAVASLTSCSDTHDEKGYVIEKNHREPYNTVMVTMVYTGKTLIPITYIIHHSETWSLELRDEVEGEYVYNTVYLKNTEVWNKVSVGDYFIWDEETCFDCEPTTKERQ